MRKLKTMDGNTAAAHVAYAFTEVAAIYPITPSSVMAELVDEWSANGRENIFGRQVSVVEMQSEGGAAGAVHGSLTAGAFTTTFTASQGLLLMIPNMYKIASELTPAVFHVSARAIATHALSIFGDHSDVMSCRSTGFAMLASSNPQEVMDLAAVAHLSTITGRVPMIHFFDGFRTSHEQQKIEVWDYDTLKSMVDWDAVADFRAQANNPNHPFSKGSAENPDTFFQHREAANRVFTDMPDVVNAYMQKVNAEIGTDYKPFNYYGAPDATEVVIAMGSVCDTAAEVVDYLNARGRKVGLVTVHLYRPFSPKYLLEAIPETAQRIAVLDRCKEPGAVAEPLYLDVAAALRGTRFEKCLLVGGRYGLGSKDTQPGAVLSVYDNLVAAEPKNGFTISIEDDVTGLSLPMPVNPDTTAAGTVSCKFWGLGSDGTVGANKNSIKIIGDNTDQKVQAYFQYDSKKSGGVTISHLRFGPNLIKSPYYITQANFVACHNPSYIQKYDIVQDVKDGGVFLLNCSWTDEELETQLPAACKRYIAEHSVRFYTCDAISLAKSIGLGGRTNSILQAAFFKLSDIIPIEDAVGYMKDAIRSTYAAKGANIVAMNEAAVDAGVNAIHQVTVPAAWKTAVDAPVKAELTGGSQKLLDYVRNVMVPANAMRGDSLPVSTFLDTMNGCLPSGTAAYEKRGIAVDVPSWDPAACVQCNYCAYICPHAAIRPFALTDEEVAVSGVTAIPLKKAEGLQFAIGISPLDCTGCGSCVSVCPAHGKALELTPIAECSEEQEFFNWAVANVSSKDLPYEAGTVKGSQFRKPLLEFSGACAGCGETPYAKLVTQMFGDRMFIANATGCSSIWGNSAPSTPYTVNSEGRGPAWSNSLFEDNAEFGFGMVQAVKARRASLVKTCEKLISVPYCDEEIAETAKNWLAHRDDAELSRIYGDKLLAMCVEVTKRDYTGSPFEKAWLDNGKKCPCEACGCAREIVSNGDMLAKPSFWVFGGDGWAYDIGYGGLDHVLASGENVNVLVFDTEVYSNTGGQSSKSTPIGAVAQFAAAGKAVKKKDLAQIAMSYGYVYVAQVAMGADMQQTLDAIREAESYDGPSLIIAYAPCINHGVKAGMGKAMYEMRNAVRAGYWNLLRYDPRVEAEGGVPLTLDSEEASTSYQDFIMGEVRYNSLTLKFPDRAKDLFAKAEEAAAKRFEDLSRKRDSYKQ